LIGQLITKLKVTKGRWLIEVVTYLLIAGSQLCGEWVLVISGWRHIHSSCWCWWSEV